MTFLAEKYIFATFAEWKPSTAANVVYKSEKNFENANFWNCSQFVRILKPKASGKVRPFPCRAPCSNLAETMSAFLTTNCLDISCLGENSVTLSFLLSFLSFLTSFLLSFRFCLQFLAAAQFAGFVFQSHLSASLRISPLFLAVESFFSLFFSLFFLFFSPVCWLKWL